MPDEEMPELDFDSEPVDLTPLLLRQFAWDTADHDPATVNAVLARLGLPPSQPGGDGEDADHLQSDYRMSFALPLEILLQAYASVLGTVLSASVLEEKNVAIKAEDVALFAEQTAEIVLASSRAVAASLISQGILTYGPGIVGAQAIDILDGDDDG